MIVFSSSEAFELNAAMQECELAVRFEGTLPTIELLEAVANWATHRYGQAVSLTAAWCLWWSVCQLTDLARRKTQRLAEIGHWLNIDARTASPIEVFGLAQNVPRIQAQKRLHAGQFDPTDHASVYRLVLLATGDEAQARRAQAIAAERFVDSKMGVK